MMSWLKLGKTSVRVAILLAAAPAGLFSQWPSYPTAGVPRTPDGKPNLTAPAPKTADGKPDLTGIWQYARPTPPPGTPAPTPASATPPATPGAKPEIIPASVRLLWGPERVRSGS